MKRVIVIGCPGAGKSTFSLALARATGLPLFHLDRMNWNEDGTAVPKPVFRERLAQAMARPRWILDGNYMGTMAERVAACDGVFFLDYPREVCLEGALRRRGKPRPDLPWVEPEGEIEAEFLRFIESFAEESRPKILKLLEAHPEKERFVFTARAQAEAYLERITAQAGGCL